MRKLALVLLVGSMAAPALGDDDPAITVCEHILKEQLKAPKTYERVSAVVAGLKVDITYDAVNSYNAPLRGRKTCVFKLDGDGRFHLSSDFSDVTRKMEVLTQEGEQLKSSGTCDTQCADKFRQRSKALEREFHDQFAVDLLDLLVAAKLSNMPLDPATTSLGK